ERVASELRASPDALSIYAAYARARREYMASRWATAREAFARVLPQLDARHSALTAWCRMFLAIIDYQEGGVGAAAAACQKLLRETLEQPPEQPLLLARIRWMLGHCSLLRGRFDEAAREYQAARRLFEQAQDRAQAGYMSEQLADVLDFLGRHDLAWA